MAAKWVPNAAKTASRSWMTVISDFASEVSNFIVAW
jgi:hypothetical protein